MVRPSPVPPYSRVEVTSACWKASKIRGCLSAAMPMPVSTTSNSTRARSPALASGRAVSEMRPAVG